MKILFIDFTTGLSSLSDLATKGRGGMVSSLIAVPDELARLGHDVAVLSDMKKAEISGHGVLWKGGEDGYNAACGVKWDVVVYNRGMADGFPEIQTRRRILWTHDSVHGGFIPDPRLAERLDAVVFMSNYAERIWRLYYKNLPREYMIPNGVDPKRFYYNGEQRYEAYILYAAAPNRGLRLFANVASILKEKYGDAIRLRAYSNMRTQHPTDKDNYDDAYEAARNAGVELMDCVPQAEIAKEMRKATCMAIPNNYPEICSNVTLQSLASGLPFVSTGYIGSVNEWVKDRENGLLTTTTPNDGMVYLMEFSRCIVRLLELKKKQMDQMRSRAVSTPGIYSWEQIGLMWVRMLERVI